MADRSRAPLSRLALAATATALAACVLVVASPARPQPNPPDSHTPGSHTTDSQTPDLQTPGSKTAAGATSTPAPAATASPGTAGQVACDVPAALAPRAGRLVNAARALRPGARLDILALGSALVGPHLGAADAFPQRMLERLRQLRPHARVQLDMQSDRGATAADLVSLLRTTLERRSYQLVLWQTGTVDAARRLRPAEFGRALADGLRVARAHGSDVILVDPQFSRLLESRADLAPYEAAILREAASPGTQLFPRFALMRYWVSNGAVDIESAPRHDRRAAVERLQACLAEALAQAIATGAAPPTPSGVIE